MSESSYTDEQLNLFIDNQLDTAEKDAIRHSILEDAVLRERVCQLKAVRELVGYAYENVPEADAAVEPQWCAAAPWRCNMAACAVAGV